MDIAVMVAVISSLAALVTSLIAARASRTSARHVRDGVERVNSVNQRIAALDRDAEELRDAYKAAVSAMANFRSQDAGREAMASLEVLSTCRATDDDLEEVATRLQKSVTLLMQSGATENAGDDMRFLRTSYRRVQRDIARDRAEYFERSMSELDGWAVRLLQRIGG